MSRVVLLDANLLIGAFDGEDDNPQHQEAKERLRAMLVEPQTRLAITPLIRYEVLRGVKTVTPSEMEARLNDFEEFEIKEPEARRAAEIFRAAKKQGKSFDKHQFDVFHFGSAELHNLEFNSLDGDMKTIREVAQASTSNTH